MPAGGSSISEVRRGYLSFRLPNGTAGETERREWNDLKSVAGTAQTVGFGSRGYLGRFGALRPDTQSGMPPYILERCGNALTDMRVRPATETPGNPAAYQANAGVVKLSDKGSHAEVVKLLKAALPK